MTSRDPSDATTHSSISKPPKQSKQRVKETHISDSATTTTTAPTTSDSSEKRRTTQRTRTYADASTTSQTHDIDRLARQEMKRHHHNDQMCSRFFLGFGVALVALCMAPMAYVGLPVKTRWEGDAIWDSPEDAFKEVTRWAWQTAASPQATTEISPFHQMEIAVTCAEAIWVLHLLNLPEYKACLSWLRNDLDVRQDVTLSSDVASGGLLAGLLSVYRMTNETVFLKKAEYVGDRILTAHRHHCYQQVNLMTGATQDCSTEPSEVVTSRDLTAALLEFSSLSALTNNQTFMESAIATLKKARNRYRCDPTAAVVVFADRVLKMSIMFRERNDDDPYFREFLELAQHIRSRVRVTPETNITFIGDVRCDSHGIPKKTLETRMECSSCGIVGTFSQAVLHFRQFPEGRLDTNLTLNRYLNISTRLVATCAFLHNRTLTFMAPHAVHFAEPSDVSELKPRSRFRHGTWIPGVDAHSSFADMTLVSMVPLISASNNTRYFNWAWDIFMAYEVSSRHPDGGYFPLKDVEGLNSRFISTSAFEMPSDELASEVGENREHSFTQSAFFGLLLKVMLMLFGGFREGGRGLTWDLQNAAVVVLNHRGNPLSVEK